MIAATRARPSKGAPRTGRSPGAAALTAYLQKMGMKRSRQRERIADAFFALPGHVTVEDVAARARTEDPRVSLATVYRTMKLLADSGLAAARQFGGGQLRYEAAAGRHHHDHLICRVCGEIAEFSSERIESLQAVVARRHGFDVEEHRLELYGRCPRCRPARGGGRA